MSTYIAHATSILTSAYALINYTGKTILNQTPKLGKFYQVTQTRQTINNSGDRFKCFWKMLSKLCEFQIITPEKMNSEQRMTCDQTCWQA